MVRLQPFGILVTVPFPVHAGMNWSKKQVHPNGRGMIDDFRHWGSRRCRRKVSALQTWGRTPGPDMSSATTTPLSERAESSPLWSKASPKRSTGRGTTRISRVRYGKAKRGCASRVPLPRAAAARRTGGVLVVGATPGFSPLMRHERGQGRTGLRTPCPPLIGGRSHHQ